MNEEKEVRQESGAKETPKMSWELTPDGMLQEKRVEAEETTTVEPNSAAAPACSEPQGEPSPSAEKSVPAEPKEVEDDAAAVWSNLPRPVHRKQPRVQATIVSSKGDQDEDAENSDGGKRKTKKSKQKGTHRLRTVDLRILLVILIVLIVIALVFGAILLKQNGEAKSAMADSGFSQGDGKNGDTSTDEKAEQSLKKYDGDSSGITMNLVSKQGKPVLSYEALYEKCAPSAVSITVENQSGSGSGTGIIMTTDGYIITCAHLIQNQSKATITTGDGTEYNALLVGSDVQTDLALLKIDATGLTAAEFGNADELTVGDEALAIGDPLGATFRGTLTNGIISAINRDVTLNGYSMNLIQTTAALNSGNSGGPLLNLYGQVVGINNMKMVSSSTTVEGLGFAVPTTTAKEIIEALAKDGGISRPVLGITCYGVTQEAAEKNSSKAGLVVVSVNKASDCSAKGIQVGDLITAIDGKEFTSVADFKKYAADFSVGKTVTLTVYRPQNSDEIDATGASSTSAGLIKATDYQSLGNFTVAMMDQQDLN